MLLPMTLGEIAMAQRDDVTMGPIMHWLEMAPLDLSYEHAQGKPAVFQQLLAQSASL